MRFLIDSHVLLWWLFDKIELSQLHKNLITDQDNVIYVSAATIWELGIKIQKGKLDKVTTGMPEMLKGIELSGFLPLPISFEHAVSATKLPLIHADSFDRILIGQAKTEKLALLTEDSAIKQYDVPVM